MKILADRNMAGVEARFGALGDVELFDGRQLSALHGADLLLVRSVTRVDAALLGDHRPRFVGSATSGFDHVDREALHRLGVPFGYAPGSNADSVVDYVLSVLCRCGRLDAVLDGAPVGIIGYGHIGRRLQQRLARLGVNCRSYDPWFEVDSDPVLDSLEAVLDCPVVSVHAALTRLEPWPSFHMLDASTLHRLPAGALLINAGRGELIATGELLSLGVQRPDLDLVLDVWEEEPDIDAGLLARCRFGTAHIAGYSYDGKLRATDMLYAQACAVLDLAPAAGMAGLGLTPVEAPALPRAELACWLLEQVYDVREDDRLLRDAGPAGFDGLRKGYRERRELSSLRIANGADLDADSRSLCEALGCEVATC